MKFLYRPVKDAISQPFGGDPSYYQNLNFKGHPGIDFASPHGTPIYSPCDADAFYATDKYGGDGIYLRYPNNVQPIYNIILWHMVTPGDQQYPFKIDTTKGVITKVKAGDLLGYSDNSGFPKESTGDHLHFGLMPCDSTGGPLDRTNGFGGCIDPAPYLFDIPAEELPQLDATIEATQKVVDSIISAPLTPTEKGGLLSQIKTLILKVASFFK